MAFLQIAAAPIDDATNIILELGKIGRWLQALGIIIILWLIFQIIALINRRIHRKRLYTIEERLENIEKKLDKALKK